MAKKDENVVAIRPMEVKTFRIRIVGDTPLIVHAWSEKARRQMLEAQMGTAKTKKKEPKNPVADFMDSMYWLTPRPEESTMEAFEKAVAEGARFGFKVMPFKLAGNSAAYRKGWVKNQMGLRGAYFLRGDDDTDMVEIHADRIVMREDNVKVGMGTADLRYRAEFHGWYCDLTVELDIGAGYSTDDIVNVINCGGFNCGVGEWRPEKDGMSGRYHVQTIE